MKKTIKRLSVTAERIRLLSGPTLGRVVGGDEGISMSASCTWTTSTWPTWDPACTTCSTTTVNNQGCY